PYEDDSRQRAFLDAVRRAGLQVVVKRLPPKGITRQVSVEVEMASDIVAFGLGQNSFEDIGFDFSDGGSESRSVGFDPGRGKTLPRMPGRKQAAADSDIQEEAPVTAPVEPQAAESH